jgi:hypothetical protein
MTKDASIETFGLRHSFVIRASSLVIWSAFRWVRLIWVPETSLITGVVVSLASDSVAKPHLPVYNPAFALVPKFITRFSHEFFQLAD